MPCTVMENYKYVYELKESYVEHPYTHRIDSIIDFG